MTFVINTENNLHEVDRTTNARFLADLNTPGNSGTKPGGNLPISGPGTSGEWDNTTVGNVEGVSYDFQASQAAWDVSAAGTHRILVWGTQVNAPNRIQCDTVANGGFRIRIYSGTGTPPADWADFYIGGNDTFMGECVKGSMPFVIDLDDDTEDATGGSGLDHTDITAYAILTDRVDLSGTSTNWNFMQHAWVFQTVKGSADTPTFSGSGSNFQQAVTLLQGSDFTDKLGNWVRQIGSVIFIDVGFRMGDNSTLSTFSDQGLTVVSPTANDATDPRRRITTLACRTYLDFRDSMFDSGLFSGTWIWGTRALFDWVQSGAAVVTFVNPIFIGMGEFSIGTSITGPATFDDVDKVDIAVGTDIDGSTFKNPNGSYALELGGVMNIADMRFESYSGAIALLIDTAGTYELSNVFFDKTGTFEVENSSAGTVTLQLVNGSTALVAGDVTNTGGGSIVIENNVNLSIQVADAVGADIENAQCYIEAGTGGPETPGTSLMNEDTTSGGLATETYNYASDQPINWRIRKSSTGSTRYFNLSGTGTILSTGFSLAATLQVDSVASA